MQVLVMYFSKTGNTKLLAEQIAKGVEKQQGAKCAVKPADSVTKEDFLASDAIIAGSPVYFGSMASELKKVFDKYVGLRKQMENKVGAAFATSGDSSGGKETTIFSILQAMLIYGMVIAGDPMDATGHYGMTCVGAPDAGTAENAAKFGKRIAGLAAKLKS
ncbi:MAG: NAD(P)H-dependent oxidoreductase [Candidatus Aureabacteria bacterium]|nr:NAD(P)H-dependent oxidoreductase [Candidatus Auribacterota bacterium]